MTLDVIGLAGELISYLSGLRGHIKHPCCLNRLQLRLPLFEPSREAERARRSTERGFGCTGQDPNPPHAQTFLPDITLHREHGIAQS